MSQSEAYERYEAVRSLINESARGYVVMKAQNN